MSEQLERAPIPDRFSWSFEEKVSRHVDDHRYLFRLICDGSNLGSAFDQVRSKRRAPGLDGVDLQGLNSYLKWRLIGSIKQQLINNSYQSRRERPVEIPKFPEGTRSIILMSQIDRFVHKAVLDILDLVIDPQFRGLSFGGRTGFSILHALAIVKHLTEELDRWVLIADDIKQAFDMVPLGNLYVIISQYFSSPETLELLKNIVPRKNGKQMRQGSPLSPLLMNAYLNKILDVPFLKNFKTSSLIRYVDDILVPCMNMQEAESKYLGIQRLLHNGGLELKGNASRSICDLRNGSTIQWLGYQLAHVDSQLAIRLEMEDGSKALYALSLSLIRALRDLCPAVASIDVLKNFFLRHGAAYAFSDRDRVIKVALDTAKACGFTELPEIDYFQSLWKIAGSRWNQLCALAPSWHRETYLKYVQRGKKPSPAQEQLLGPSVTR